MNSAVTFDTVSYKIGKNILLEDITFRINEGTITGILGPNGAGKTTLLSLINGLRKHTSGTITEFEEQLPMKGQKMHQRIGVVLQETALYEELTTFENLNFSASLYNIKNPKTRIIEVLGLLNLEDRSDQIVRTLSGGLRRRIAIARALLHDPELLIIDEPTLGVDVEARHAIWQHLRLLKAKGRTVIVATNYLDEAQALCDTVAVLRKGKLLTVEDPESLIARAGYCLEVECTEEEGKKITERLSKESGIISIDKTVSGLFIFFENISAQDEIITIIVKTSHISGFRLRAPDLAEIFKSL
ncbi:MAG: ABC transporter ATP-binding protein [Candidatus Levyibacteriota bacterium]